MKTRSEGMKVRVLSFAVQGALAAMCVLPAMAQAADDKLAALTQPTNTIEVGVENVSQKSAKFGEYTGLRKSGGELIGNFSVSGGDAYGNGSGTGTTRWGITGSDLGTTSRAFGGSVSSQGKWDLSIGYDELRHSFSDTFQTPQQGSMGGNNFTMPTNFGNLNGAAPAARVLTAVQQGAFHTEEVGTTRKNTSFAAAFNFNPQLSLKFDYNHLDQSGAKLMGTGSQGGITLIGGSTGRAEANNVIMNPTNYKTDTLNLALNWVGDRGHLTGAYYGSIFRDGYNSLSWQGAMSTAASACVGVACFVNNTMSTAPSNNFHQLNLIGGYAFSPSTKLAGGFSYSRNTQNDSYAPTSIAQNGGALTYDMMQAGGLPRSSLDGLVVARHADLKLTNQTTKDLVLSAAYKFNERDNRTPSNTYLYMQLGNGAYTGVNTPFSNRKTQIELAGDYRLARNQNIRLAYERESIKRWCNGVADGFQCVASPSSGEDKLGLTYRAKASDSVKFNAGYAHAKRSADIDTTYLSNAGDRKLQAINTNHGVFNGGNYQGFVAYNYASRTQDILKAGVNWQASEELDVGLKGRYSKDKYDAALGVQSGDTASINLDATYTYSPRSSVSAYASMQNSERDLRDASAPVAHAGAVATTIWTNQLKEDSNAIGLTTKHTGLMGGKLELLGDLSYSLDKSHYSTQVPYLATCGAAGTLTCGDTPDIKAKLLTFKLTGTYQVDKSSKVALAYQYQKLSSEDYYYNGYQYGYTPNRVVPTNEQAPNYSVNLIGVSYIHSFK